VSLELPDVGACLSDDRVYRYWLGRVVPTASLVSTLGLGSEPRRVLFVMLNPSTASETANDPTIRKLLSYAKAWDFARLDVVNLFAYRSPSPDELARVLKGGGDIVGPENEAYIEAAAMRAHKVVVAWGGRVPAKLKQSRPSAVLERLRAIGGDRWRPEYLELAKDGTPKHPLYLQGSLVPQAFTDPRTPHT
jgi:hypothetical protein